MPISSAFTVEGNPISGAMTVAYGTSVDLVVTSLTDINTIVWSVVGSSESTLTNPTITPAGNPTGATASFPMVADPDLGEGVSFGIKCLATDSGGNTDSTTATIGVESPAGEVPGWAGETTERDATHGWGPPVNRAMADNISYYDMSTSTDNTEFSAIEVALADDMHTTVSCRVCSHATAGDTDSLLREWTFAYHRVSAGAPTKIVPDSDGGVYAHFDDATWEAKVDLSGNTMRIRIVNDAANNCTTRTQLWVTQLPAA